MCSHYPESKVEISGLTAKYYDKLMDIFTLGTYSSFVQKAIQLMNIQPGNKIIDLGAGTGRNACLMMNYLSTKGEFVGLDISSEMVAQFESRCANFTNAKIINQRIDKPLRYENEFDKA
ncbi:MAG: methyltransferase domain-containing protein, partial [Candidatus Caldatribacteriota bacterium]|nr:methyltransferase domain-containing protein [Candidatus Caldatribacteriota bacterium]